MSQSKPYNIHRILIAIDDSQPAKWAVDVGLGLAEQIAGKVMLLHVIEPRPIVPGRELARLAASVLRDQAEALLMQARLSFPLAVEVETALRDGVFPAPEILAVAKEWKADVIILGTRGRGRLEELVLGSTADAVMRRSPCPVITVASEPKSQSIEQQEWTGVGSDCADPISAHSDSAIPCGDGPN